MGLGGCYSCIKYMMFAFNFLFWLLGCAIMGVGIWVRVDPGMNDYVKNAEAFQSLYTGAYILIVIGVIVMVIGFLGCCGAIRESQCMLATFFIFLFIIFAILIGAGIWGIFAKDKIKAKIQSTLQDAVDRYHDDPDSKKLMDTVQKEFNCCGSLRGAGDYGANPPDTCITRYWDQGCSNKLFEYVREHLHIIAGVSIGIGCVMLLGMMLSMALCCTIRRASRGL